MKDYTKKTENVLENWETDGLLEFPDDVARALFFGQLVDMQETAHLHGKKAEKRHRKQLAAARHARRQHDEV